jgi:hypothetical protein
MRVVRWPFLLWKELMNPLDLTKEEACALLAPQRQYTDAEHMAAWNRFVLECVHDRLSSLMFDIQRGELTLETIGQQLNDILYPEGGADFGWAESSAWTGWWTPENLRKTAETGQHCGDCTAVPASCIRCLVDDFYLVNTRAWTSKREGSAILNRAYPRETGENSEKS